MILRKCVRASRSIIFLLLSGQKNVSILQLRHQPGVEKEFFSRENYRQFLTVVKHIPPQLHLCYSSLPGAGFGIIATELIPSGTWIGPYEGKRISVEEISKATDTRYIWEVSY